MSAKEEQGLQRLALPGASGFQRSETLLRLYDRRVETRVFPVYIGRDDEVLPENFAAFASRFIADEERPSAVYDLVHAGGRALFPIIISERYECDILLSPKLALIRLAPEDLPALIEELPDPFLIAEIVLRDDHDPRDVWNARELGMAFVAAATASPLGVITFHIGYKDEAREILKHEWAHVLHWGLAALADQPSVHFLWKARAAALAESDGFFLRDAARRNEGENFAIHMGECFLAADPTDFLRFVEAAPVRSAVYADILAHVLLRAPINMPCHGVYLRRVEYVREAAQAAAAAALLAATNKTDDPETRSLLASLLALYGEAEDLAALRHPARFSLAYDPFLSGRTITRVSRTPRIEALDLSGAKGIRWSSLVALEGTGIERLSIKATHFDNAAAGVIVRLGTLRELNADDTLLTDDTVPSLGTLARLERLSLIGTRLSQAGLMQLRALLPNARIEF